MEITIYAKKFTGEGNKAFYRYLSTLPRKDGGKQTVAVKFREECGSPKAEKCPMNIIVDKKDANIATKEFVREDTGEVGTSFTLWVSKWKEGSPFVDKSLDEFDV